MFTRDFRWSTEWWGGLADTERHFPQMVHTLYPFNYLNSTLILEVNTKHANVSEFSNSTQFSLTPFFKLLLKRALAIHKGIGTPCRCLMNPQNQTDHFPCIVSLYRAPFAFKIHFDVITVRCVKGFKDLIYMYFHDPVSRIWKRMNTDTSSTLNYYMQKRDAMQQKQVTTQILRDNVSATLRIFESSESPTVAQSSGIQGVICDIQ